MFYRNLENPRQEVRLFQQQPAKPEIISAYNTWQKGGGVIGVEALRCKFFDRTYDTSFSNSATEVCMQDIFDQYMLLEKYMKDFKPCLEAARIGATFNHMTANLERRFRASQIYDLQNLGDMTRIVFEQGVACFSVLELKKRGLLDHPETLSEFLSIYFPKSQNI
jgi:hypothetical protein